MPWENNNQNGPWGGGSRRPSGSNEPNFDEVIKRAQERLKDAVPGGFGGSYGLILLLAVFLVIWV